MVWKPGESGNPAGRGKGVKSELEKLREAVKQVEEKKGIRLYEHFVKKAFEDNSVLIALCKKLVPDLKQIDGSIERKQLNLLSISMNPELQNLIQAFLGQMAKLELDKSKPKVLDMPGKEGKEGELASSEPSGSMEGS